jgi:hypothetical protein
MVFEQWKLTPLPYLRSRDIACSVPLSGDRSVLWAVRRSLHSTESGERSMNHEIC